MYGSKAMWRSYLIYLRKIEKIKYLCPSSWAAFWIWLKPIYSTNSYFNGPHTPPILLYPITWLLVAGDPVKLLQISRLQLKFNHKYKLFDDL